MAKEIERRFVLGRTPCLSTGVLAGADVAQIEQTYLRVDAPARTRIRQVTRGPLRTYYRTAKTKVGIAGVREEDETAISRAEFDALAVLADPDRSTVHKTRYTFDYAGQVFELDRVDAPVEVWLLEAELGTLEQLSAPLALPPQLSIAAEVTGVKGWSNAALARGKVPALIG